MKFSMSDRKQTDKLQVVSLKAVKLNDDSPDLSWLGEYSDHAETISIDRQARGDCGRGEYRYFNLGTGDAEYIEQDYARMEAYNRGDWQCIGIKAVAVVARSLGGACQMHEFESAGLWGTESDSDAAYLRSIAEEQVAELLETLKDFGVPTDNVEADYSQFE